MAARRAFEAFVSAFDGQHRINQEGGSCIVQLDGGIADLLEFQGLALRGDYAAIHCISGCCECAEHQCASNESRTNNLRGFHGISFSRRLNNQVGKRRGFCFCILLHCVSVAGSACRHYRDRARGETLALRPVIERNGPQSSTLADVPLLARCSLWPLHSESCRLNNKTAKDRIGSNV